jgi:ABC-type multidrug transport system permease subunit
MPANLSLKDRIYLPMLLGWKDCVVRFQHRVTFVFIVVLPVAMTLITGLAFKGFEPSGISTSLAVVGDPDDPLVKRLRQVIDEMPKDADQGQAAEASTQGANIDFNFNLSAEEARRRVESGNLGGALIVPPGQQAKIDAGEKVDLELQVKAERSLARSVIEGTVDRIVNRAALPGTPALAWTADPLGTTTQQFNSFTQAVTGNGVMFILLNCIVNGGMAIVREKRQNTLSRLLISPMTPGMIIAGKTFGVFVVGVIQAVVVFGFGLIVGVRPRLESVPGVIMITLLLILVASALGLLVSALARREEAVEAMGAPISLVLTALGGGMFPVEMAPAWMRTVSMMLPTGWAMDGYHKLLWEGLSWTSVLPNLAVLSAFAAVFLFVGIRYLRWD